MEPLAPELVGWIDFPVGFCIDLEPPIVRALVCLVPKNWNLKILVFLDLFEILQCFTFKKCYLLLVNSHLGKFLEIPEMSSVLGGYMYMYIYLFPQVKSGVF